MEKRVVVFGWAHRVHLQRWVRAMSQRGFAVRVISLGGDDLAAESLGARELVAFPYNRKTSYIRYLGPAARAARDFTPHLVHAHYVTGFGLWTIAAGVRPTLVSVWGADIIDFPNSFIKRALVRRVLQRADRITATSQFLLEATANLAPSVRDKVTVIPFGVTVPDTMTSLPDEPPVRLCYIKAHRAKYGPDVLLRAMDIIKGRDVHVELSIAGEGEMTAELKRLTTRLGLDDRVRFVGFVENEQIYEFIAEHHVMVMPSILESESFGVAVLEAAACGRPTVASRVGGVSEVIRDGETGLLVTPKDPQALADGILKLVESRDLREEMGKKARRLVEEQYRWEKSVDMMAELYDRMIHGAKNNTAV